MEIMSIEMSVLQARYRLVRIYLLVQMRACIDFVHQCQCSISL